MLLILVILGIHSCQVSARNSALKDYNNNVAAVATQSLNTGSQLFQVLATHTGGSSNAANLEQQISQNANAAAAELKKAESFSVPDEAKAAQSSLLFALQMRHDGIVGIAGNIQQALGSASTNKDAVNIIAAQIAKLYASDVAYLDYAVPQLRSALSSALGSNNGEQQNTNQFVPSLSWLSPSYVAQRLGATLPTTPANCSSGKLYGHSLDSVSVAGTTLQTGSTNTIPASPPPKFTLNFTNGGDANEANVKFEVTVTGTSSSGSTIVTSTTAHASGSATVSLKSAPPAGTYTLVAKIDKVPCEKNAGNNSLSYPVTFQ